MKRTLSIEPSSCQIPSEMRMKIMQAVEDLNEAVPVTLFKFERLANPAVPPYVYEYKFVTVDGRTWKQEVRFNPIEDPAMTFGEIGGWWRDTEFVPHRVRVVRDLMVECVTKWPSVEEVKCTVES